MPERQRPGERRRQVEVALGVLWLLDGALQFQPYMFTRAFMAGILGMANMGLPGPLATADFHVAELLTRRPRGVERRFCDPAGGDRGRADLGPGPDRDLGPGLLRGVGARRVDDR